MRISFSFILLFTLLYNATFAIFPPNERRTEIKSVIAWKSESQNPTRGSMVSYTEYNENGNKIIVENYNSDGDLDERIGNILQLCFQDRPGKLIVQNVVDLLCCHIWSFVLVSAAFKAALTPLFSVQNFRCGSFPAA